MKMLCPNCNVEFNPIDTLLVGQIEKILDAWCENTSWNDLGHSYGTKEPGEEVPGLGRVIHVESEGGEGQGDSAHVVVKIGDRLFRKDGSYASHDGFYWDGPFREVVAKQKTITVYE